MALWHLFGKTNDCVAVTTTVDKLKAAFGRPDYPVRIKGNTPGDQFGVVADISKVARELRWRPKTDLRTGLKIMVDYEKRRHGSNWDNTQLTEKSQRPNPKSQ
jgi:nucleoside-diphosphate-sugar epimerase